MRTRIRSDFQLGIVTLFGFCSAAVILPFAIYRFLTGAIAVGILDSALVISIVAMVLYGWHSNQTERAGKFLVIINCVGALLSSEMLGVIGVFWMYAAILSNFFLTTSQRYAAAATITTLIGLAVLGKAFDTTSQMWSFLATSSLLALLSFIVAYQYKLQRQKLELLATLDPLTGIHNRRVMVQELQLAVEAYRRNDIATSVILMDIDHFKHINDQHGHEEGDRVLVAFAELAKRFTRQVDRFFRYGGEEFLLLVPGADEQDGCAIAEKIRSHAEQDLGAKIGRITVSLGVAVLRRDESWQSWVARADSALYRAKSAGRNRVVS
ncbi:GGDEF domain-containing protein [Permianibacter sp. IMCC34836]|uniref:GGDEF domain-containing protein n=1 Tax=Permianibacter fluminis TaxID=2738515 RepID=UPI00155658C4|nr:GGDEF domain-containing protein [Permianibacter fluminis]NQD36221.1 GGDEF domain-containing protein [Permianibacter fluminis]